MFAFLILFVFLSAVLLYSFQSKLVYLPQMPPGSKEEVWLPSKFGYGPGKTEEDDGSAKWEEIEIVTKDKVKLQAYWIKAPSTWGNGTEDLNTESTVRSRFNHTITTETPFTILFMQANAGNIVTLTYSHLILTRFL